MTRTFSKHDTIDDVFLTFRDFCYEGSIDEIEIPADKKHKLGNGHMIRLIVTKG